MFPNCKAVVSPNPTAKSWYIPLRHQPVFQQSSLFPSSSLAGKVVLAQEKMLRHMSMGNVFALSQPYWNEISKVIHFPIIIIRNFPPALDSGSALEKVLFTDDDNCYCCKFYSYFDTSSVYLDSLSLCYGLWRPCTQLWKFWQIAPC